MNIEEIKMDHFENFEELIKTCKTWIIDDDIDAYYRFFEFNCMETLVTAYEKEKEKNKEYEKQLDLDYAEEKIKKAYIDGTNVAHNLCNKKWVEIIQAQIQELENERKDLVYAQPFVDGQIGVLKRVLKRGEE